MKPQIVLGGSTWLPSIGAAGDLAWSLLADGGCGEASWTMDLPATFAHPALRRGQLVQIKAGSANLWAGILAQPDINTDDDGTATWSFTAAGLHTLGKGFLCLTGAGNTTTTPDVAIDAAITRGLPWIRSASVSATPFTASDQTDRLNYVGDLLDAYADSLAAGNRWGVDGDRRVFCRADDTVPTWHMTPGSGRFGLADDGYASAVFVRYWNGSKFATTSASDAMAAALYGVREFPADATRKGTLTASQASGMAAGALAKAKARLGWTNPLSPAPAQIATFGGTPAPLWMIRPGQMVRLHGVIDEQGFPRPYAHFVIGEVRYSAEGSITISPVGLVDRDLASVLATAFGRTA